MSNYGTCDTHGEFGPSGCPQCIGGMVREFSGPPSSFDVMPHCGQIDSDGDVIQACQNLRPCAKHGPVGDALAPLRARVEEYAKAFADPEEQRHALEMDRNRWKGLCEVAWRRIEAYERGHWREFLQVCAERDAAEQKALQADALSALHSDLRRERDDLLERFDEAERDRDAARAQAAETGASVEGLRVAAGAFVAAGGAACPVEPRCGNCTHCRLIDAVERLAAPAGAPPASQPSLEGPAQILEG